MKFNTAVILFPKGNGGVKEVSESLKKGITENGIEVITINNLRNAFSYILRTLSKKEKTLYISSLKFGIIGLFVKHSIFIIHGYPYYRTLNFIQYYVNLFSHRFFSIINKKVVAVSYLTRYLCQNHLAIRVTDVIHNPFPVNFEMVKTNPSYSSIVYLGRIVASKGIDKILEAMNKAREENEKIINFHIIGDGPLLEDFKKKYNHENNYFHGYTDAKQKNEILSQCGIFISLNEGEAFGITALEASSLGLLCIMPTYGGHIEFMKPSDYLSIRDIFDIDEIKSTILIATNKSDLNESKLTDRLDQRFLPQNIADKYLNLFQ